MIDRDDTPDPDPGEPTTAPPAEHRTEDTVFPEWFRSFWRSLLGPRGPR